jgi:hypothetical protein
MGLDDRFGFYGSRRIGRPPLRLPSAATSPPFDGGEEAPIADAAFLSPVERGRGAERSEAEWGSIISDIPD